MKTGYEEIVSIFFPTCFFCISEWAGVKIRTNLHNSNRDKLFLSIISFFEVFAILITSSSGEVNDVSHQAFSSHIRDHESNHLRDTLDDSQTNTSILLRAFRKLQHPLGWNQPALSYHSHYWWYIPRGLVRGGMKGSAYIYDYIIYMFWLYVKILPIFFTCISIHYWVADFSKPIRRSISCGFTRNFCLFNNFCKVFLFGITENFYEFTSWPKFLTSWVEVFDGFKRWLFRSNSLSLFFCERLKNYFW
jgi:hypothetical protein